MGGPSRQARDLGAAYGQAVALFIERLAQELERACRQRLPPNRRFGARGHEDDRETVAVGIQALLKFNPAHARHLDVRNQTDGVVRMDARVHLVTGSRR